MIEAENIIFDYIEKVCEILEIEVPNISYDASNFSSGTMLAQVRPEDYTLYLKKLKKVDCDGLFIIAHELRHLWQYKYNFKLNIYINHLESKREILEWYIAMNSGGTPHNKDEIDRVKKMLAESLNLRTIDDFEIVMSATRKIIK